MDLNTPFNFSSLFGTPTTRPTMFSGQTPALPVFDDGTSRPQGPNTVSNQTNSQLQAIQALAAIYHPQLRTDAGWGTNNATAPNAWAQMFNNTGVLGGQMQSSVAPGTNPGWRVQLGDQQTRNMPPATTLFNMATNRPSQTNPSYMPQW